MFIDNACRTLNIYLFFVGIVVLLLATLPIYSKLLKKINTSIDVEGNTNMTAVDLASDDE